MRAKLNGTDIYFDVEGAALQASDGGIVAKPTLIALHGGPGFDHGYMKPGLAPLSHHAQVIYVDLRGQGRSGRPALASCTLEQMAEDIAALCDHLGVERTFIFGHSVGGFVAMRLALAHPKLVEGLILCATSPTVSPLPDDNEAPTPTLASRAGPEVLAAAGRAFGGELTQESMADFIRLVVPFYAGPSHMDVPTRLMKLTSVDLDIMRHFMTAIAPHYDLRPMLGLIDAPTLVMVGRHDWVCPPRASRVLARGISGAKLVEFPDAGHFAFSEAPEEFLRVVTDFLATIERNAGRSVLPPS